MNKFHPNMPTVLIVGHGRSGKDEAGMFLHELGIPYGGSCSWAALPLMAKALNLPEQIAWERRHQMRELWFYHCDRFRDEAKDPLVLVRRALALGNVVTGCRNAKEIVLARDSGVFNHVLWIERPGIPVDPTVKFDSSVATEIIRNVGSLADFHYSLIEWCRSHGIRHNMTAYVNALLEREYAQ